MNQAEGATAAKILNTYTAENLQKILSEYGEVRNSKTLALALVAARVGKSYANISDLLAVSDPLSMGDKMRYRSQVFQALRMEVNDELGALKDFLQQSLEVLNTCSGVPGWPNRSALLRWRRCVFGRLAIL